MGIKELLENILEIKWSAKLSCTDLDGYYFTISADDRDRILSNINEAIAKLDSGEYGCLVCREGIEALEEKLLRNNYTQLENLSLCNTCRGILLVSIEDKVIRSEGRDEQEES